jgi:hypothetical protein
MNESSSLPLRPTTAESKGSRPTYGAYSKLRRLSRMPWSEIAGRGRQEALKWIDRIAAADRAGDPKAVLAEHGPAFANPEAALYMLRESAPQRFFAGVEDVSAIAKVFPDHQRAVVTAAAAATQNRFDLLGYRNLWFGNPIDWHLDPVWRRRSPRVHWSRLNPLDMATVGDSKIVWELNRHQWLVQLAQAYAMTGDERYAQACMDGVGSWLEANPSGIGINWSSSLEVAYRLMSWSWMLLLLRNSTALSGNRLVSVLAAIWRHANHVSRYLSHYFSPNTHLTGEALGLFYAGVLFTEFNEARRWRDLGSRILIAQSVSQICADGMHFERSTCYHRYTAETYQQFVLLAQRNGFPVPAEVIDRLRRVMEFLLAIRRPDGWIPEIGDADGGRLLPLVDRAQCDPRGIFAVAAAMLRVGDFAWASDGLTPEVAWLMGSESVRAFEAVHAVRPTRPSSRVFPSGGYAIMKSGWTRDAHQMIVDVGPLGCSFSSGHGHADLLSIQCAAFGEPCLVDAGTYCYTAEPEWRNFFRGTAAHSTVMIDGRHQVEPEGPFSWRARPAVALREWHSNADCDFVDADHDAYAPIRHRRRVMFVKPDYWVVIDDLTVPGDDLTVPGSDPMTRNVTGSDFHQVDAAFQFAPMHVSVDAGSWVRANTPGGNSFWIGSFASTSIQTSVKTGDLTPIRGWFSSDYGQRTPAPMVIYSCCATLPWRGVTVLIPRRSITSIRPDVEVLYDDHNLPIGLQIGERQESIFIDDDDVFLSRT